MVSFSRILKIAAFTLCMIGKSFQACHDTIECDFTSGVCETGTQQSPINFRPKVLNPDAICVNNPVVINLNADVIQSTMEGDDNAQGQHNTMVWSSEDGDGYQYKFDLINVHFHTGSEHRFDLKQYDIEMHMVHFDASAAAAGASRPYAVAGYIFQISGNERDPFLDYVMGHSAASSNMLVNYQPHNILHYLGGLTTPTCDEVVNWFVVYDPISISQEQYDDFVETDELHDIIGIAREAMPLNGREPIKYQYNCENPDISGGGSSNCDDDDCDDDDDNDDDDDGDDDTFLA